MGSEGNAVQLGNGEVKVENLEESCVTLEAKDEVKDTPPSGKPVSPDARGQEVKPEKLEESCITLEAKDEVKHTPPSVKPGSPDARGEGIQVPSDFTSPNTVLNLPSELACPDAHLQVHSPGSPDASSPRTPEDCLFDPFAPGNAELLMAPRRLQQTRSSIARSFNFGSSVRLAIEECIENDEEEEEEEEIALAEEELLEFLYGDVVEVIVSTQVYAVQHGTNLDEELLDGFVTPEPLLTGIADTCPPAPARPPRQGGNMDRGLCRKLALDID